MHVGGNPQPELPGEHVDGGDHSALGDDVRHDLLGTIPADGELLVSGESEDPHEGGDHGVGDGKDGGVQGVAEHLLGPVQQRRGEGQQSLSPALVLVELQGGEGGEVGGVVHGALHEELVLQGLAVQVTGHQGLQALSVLRWHPEEGATLGSKAPLVEVTGVEVSTELIQLQLQLARPVGPVNEDEDSELLQLLGYLRHREHEGRGGGDVVNDR